MLIANSLQPWTPGGNDMRDIRSHTVVNTADAADFRNLDPQTYFENN